MGPVLIDPSMPDAGSLHPVLTSAADRGRAIFVRCLAYVCGLAVLTALLSNLFAVAPAVTAVSAAPKQDWVAVSRPRPAFALNHVDLSNISEPYIIMRHPEGGRKDIMRWIATSSSKSGSGTPNAEIEIYRPGDEFTGFISPQANLAARMNLSDGWTSEPAGIVASKFGPVTLLRFAAPDGVSCLAFFRGFNDPRLQISGWTCQPQEPATLRTFVACTLDHLMLIASGNDPAVAALFAKAELRRSGCGGTGPGYGTGRGDWIATPQEPVLRGSL